MKRKLNRTDRFLILVFLCCTVGMVWRVWDLRSGVRATDGEYELLAEWKNVDVRTAACLSEGETVYTASGAVFGSVIGISALPAEVTVTDAGEIYRASPSESGRLDIYVTVGFTGGERGGMILHGGTTPVAVGDSLKLYSERCELSVTVLFGAKKSLS